MYEKTIDYSINESLTIDGYCADLVNNKRPNPCKNTYKCKNANNCKKQKEKRKYQEKKMALSKLWKYSRAYPGNDFYDNLSEAKKKLYYPIQKNGQSMMGSHTFDNLRPELKKRYQRQWANLWYRRFASQQGSTVDGWPATQLTGSDTPYISMGRSSFYTNKDYYYPRCCRKKCCSSGKLMCYKKWKEMKC